MVTSDRSRLPLALFIMGPTAAGKTDLAIALQEYLPGRIISVDSAMIYRGMDIGTAKPGPGELERAPHRLIDIVDPAQHYSVGDFCRDARREMDAAVAEGRVPLLTGGTMMYFKALRDGFAEMPASDPAVRQRLLDEAASSGWDSLYQRLQQADPEAAAGMHPHNHQRLLRALEVLSISGQPLSRYWAAAGRWDGKSPPAPTLPYNVLELALVPADRAALHRRIEARFRSMLDQGFLEEVRALRQRPDLDLEKPSMRCVGYRQAWQFLDGNFNYQDFVDKGMAATRQLAKRQLTWLRRWDRAHSVEPLEPNLFRNVLKLIGSHTTLS